MASPAAKFFSFLFLASLLLLSQQAQARESQFFSKVTHVQTPELPKTQTTVPVTKQEQEQEKEQEPSFVPETQGGYGLYGHESGQLPPTTTTTPNGGAPTTTTTTTPTHDAPYTTTSALGVQYKPNNNQYTTEAEVKEEQHTNKYPETYHTQYTTEAEVKEEQHTNKYPETYHTQYKPNRNNVYYNGNFEANPSGLSDTRLTQTHGSSYTTPTPTHYQNSNNYYNAEKQGMSDTRFLDNGKYYHDISSENNYNQNQYENSRVVDSRNWYNNRASYGNNNVNQNTYNSMEGYQNEEQFQEIEDDEFIP